MSVTLTLAVLALAAYRLTRLATTDSLFASWRHRWYRRFPPNDHYRAMVRQPGQGWVQGPNPVRRTHPLGQLVECPWCIGAWISIALVATTAQYISIPLPVLVAAATSTVVGLLGELDS